MAVLAPQDWHPPRDHIMDAPSPNAINPSVPRQRSSPANEHSLAQSPMSQQQPYPYPVQQQQAAWAPPPQQFYPQFYQNPHQQPYPMHGHPGHPPQGQMPYYDPANAQLAQWAYQQMMFNAQQQAHQMSQMNGMNSQRGRNGGNPNPDYFAQSPMSGFSPFPSGTPPPPHPSQLPMGYSPTPSEQGSQYAGYHPYRRPQRQGSSNHDPDWRSGSQHSGPFKPPYAHADAAGSSTSVNSGSSQSGSQRQRTNSNQGPSAGGSGSAPSPAHSHSKQASSRSNTSGSTPPPATNGAAPPPRVHQRTGSSSSNASARLAAPSTTPTSSNAAPVNLRKPSPLSQGTFTAAEKRMSRDDSDLAAMLETSGGPRSSGLKGRLRRALSLNANATLHEEADEDVTTRLNTPRPSQSSIGSSATLAMDDGDSTATVQKKKSRSLFNNKFNRSTDNISLSSTMSSASMVIRKLGSIGKLARRNSLAGITSLFKDKKDKDEEEGATGKKDKDKKKKKGEKAAAADPSVSHVTAELDRSDWTSSPDMAGLSPAARLARQHTLKTNAEAAAKAKAEAEARAAAQAQGANLPTTWEKNTTNRQGENSPAKIGSSSKVGENGMRVVVEHDDSDSGSDGGHDNHAQSYNIEGWEDDEDWGEAHEDEDVTIRQALDNASLEEDEDMEPWAINVRRSIERTRKPAKGILKKPADGTDYTQDAYLPPNPSFTRTRSNSYDSAPPSTELPPLGHLPASDPAQIDGLHKSHGSANGHSPQTSTTFLPPLSFDSKGLALESPTKEGPAEPASVSGPSSSEKEKEKEKDKEKGTLFTHPNSSAPALSTISSANPPTLTHRSATAPAKRLAFASNLSVYDTFPATVYDRRSEPATWSRLTPALAQRIKEELNSYKMEEMEVHAASRVHTQFFV
ncbi:hypothetical protein BD309DRAFT_954401 [Dichomitus squalens]|uniref:Uncharacterized protein n=1 Tax=Dichomitus squalens TaxID=114155 RepID=A0A4Q9NZT0_9APHY|nr:hypothetical protein BD309DRAFT_954401 [Dichomitus squalens]TBU56218.1 hypothetical protein BD310DRAFT_634831 [Dichomitus squalens]